MAGRKSQKLIAKSTASAKTRQQIGSTMAYRRLALAGLFAVVLLAAAYFVRPPVASSGPQPDENGIFHVFPDGDIQAALDAAARHPKHKHVQVHAGKYRPQSHGQAFIWFNRIHDGILLEAVGDTILTAENPDVARRRDQGYPAIVNHVIYFGDGITRKTVLRGFKITGANGYVTTSEPTPIEPQSDVPHLERDMFFYTDGGGIKVFGRSYPVIEAVKVYGNFASPCGAGISIEHRGYTEKSVLLKDCIFRDNRCTVTGSAVDVLNGSSAVIENCLFLGNLSNTHIDHRAKIVGKWKPIHGSGALTVFPESRVVLRRCSFIGNRNGIDDSSQGNRYEDSIFWKNNASGGWQIGQNYELDLADGKGVRNCFLNGDLIDLNQNINKKTNVLICNDPDFNESFVPQAEGFEGAGYRPVRD